MGDTKYVKVNVTALKSAMTGFKAGALIHCTDKEKSIIELFEDMILSYIANDERNEENEQKEEK